MRFRLPKLTELFTTMERGSVESETIKEEIPAFGGEINSKLENSMRFAFQNVNGLSIGSTQEGSELALVIESLGIDVLGMAETNINWNQDRRTQLLSLLQMVFGNGQIATSSSQSGTDGYQPGGTALVAHGCSAGRISCRRGDRMGRYSYMALRGKDGCGVLVISAYRVCQSRGTVAGPDTAFMQQVAALRSAGVVNPDPRNQILDDLTDLITEWKEKGYHPLIGIDANSFAVAGSFVLFFLALEMILGIRLYKEDNPSTASIVPIAFPLIAGAGTMTTILSLRAAYDKINIIIAIVINVVVVYGVLKSSGKIERLLGVNGLGVIRKVFGVILLAIAVKLFAANVKGLFI